MIAHPPITPRVAICLCTHNRPQGLRRVLLAARHIELDGYEPRRVEMIVVDNNPDPKVKAICDQAAPGLPITLRYVAEPQAGFTYVMNRAVREGLALDADFLAFIDDDDEPRPDWLLRLLECQADTGADIVFGAWETDTRDIPEWARKSRLYRPPVKGRDGLPRVAGSGNVLIGRQALNRVLSAGEAFDHRFCFSGGADRDFFIRAKNLGAKLALAERSIIQRGHEPHRYTVRGVINRGFTIGHARVLLARVHGGMPRVVGMALLELSLFSLLFPFSLFSKGRFMWVLYRIARPIGALYTAVTGRGINYLSRWKV